MSATLPVLSFSLESLDEMTSKAKLAQCLGTSRQTLNVYHGLASLHIDGFIANYPKVGDKAYTRAGMNKYQSWVLGRLIYEGMRLTYKVLEAKLEDINYAETFSYNAYTKAVQEY
ncbi:hypothetical protein NIES4106_62410 (plasmid) [Fischerella sp. NIES-4106]|nr:hypothetical protein NIES4106_62410 [Fischerella sp. NIES-4106]